VLDATVLPMEVTGNALKLEGVKVTPFAVNKLSFTPVEKVKELYVKANTLLLLSGITGLIAVVEDFQNPL
jgi:hypothetical protein